MNCGSCVLQKYKTKQNQTNQAEQEMDFTYQRYTNLLITLLNAGYQFLPVRDMSDLTQPNPTQPDPQTKLIYLRHDVDLRPANSLQCATIEYKMGIKATYYFRAVPESYDEDIIRQIAAMGHEIGYHYESLTTCNGDIDKAYEDFTSNLDNFRKITKITTISMHGSPRSKFDSKDIWTKYDYHPLDLTIEPYLDSDWSKIFYLTDTGRRWDGYKVSVRDRIPIYQEQWHKEGKTYHSTIDIIAAAQRGTLPYRIMMTTHPQRWNDKLTDSLKELILQNAKNIVKRLLVLTAR